MSYSFSKLNVEIWRKDAQDRIRAQEAIVARTVPGSEAHRSATEILLLLRDCLHTMGEAKATIEKLKKP